jgi:predicted transport protein
MMKLYELKGKKLSHIRSTPFQLERDIQNVVEENVEELFGLELVKSELSVGGFRFDTLCFDGENNSFVIIEYKKGSSYSVIDQGYTYLSILLNNKSDFILEYNETKGKTLKRDEIDWSQSRIIFISPKFSEYQKNSINFKNVPFELWEITRFENDTVGLNRVETNSEVDINTTSTDETNVVNQVSKEVVKIDEDFHLYKNNSRPDGIIELYQLLKERILRIGDDLEIRFNKQTIGFRTQRVICDVIIYNKGLIVMINLKKGELNDPLNKTEDVSSKGHWGSGDYRIFFKSEDDLEYVISLIKQSYNKQGD